MPDALHILAQADDPAASTATAMKAILLLALAVLVLAAAIGGWRDLVRLSPRRLWALSLQTVRESIRRRVLLLVPGAMVFIIGVGLFQRSVDEVGDIHQSIDLCIRTSSALTVILLVLLAVFSFPREIETRTIYSLLSKPVTRLELLLGKLVGLILVGGLVLLIMGAFSYGYLFYRTTRLAPQARQRLEQQQRQYEQYQAFAAQRGQPTSRPDFETRSPVALPPGMAPRYEPADAALRQQVDMGLLAAMNFVTSDEPVEIGLDLPEQLRDTPFRWFVTGRGYLPLYAFKLPPAEQRADIRSLQVFMSLPGVPHDEDVTVRGVLYLQDIPPAPMDMTVSPRALIETGWRFELGEALVIPMRYVPGSGSLWQGAVALSGEALVALGPVDRLAVGLLPPHRDTPGGQFVGVLPVGKVPEPTATGAALLTVTPGGAPGAPLLPEQLKIYPRLRSSRFHPLSGSPPAGPVENALYRFEKLDQADLPPGDVVIQLKFDVEKGTPAAVVTEAIVEVTNPQTGQGVTLPAYPSTRMGSYVRVDRDMLAGGTLLVRLRPKFEDDLFLLGPDSVKVLAEPTPFAWNLLKSLAICALQATVVVTIGVMASVFLSWPVALLLTAVVIIAGNLLDMAQAMLTQQGTFIAVSGSADPSLRLATEAANAVLRQATVFVSYVVPDFTRFDPVAWVGKGLNMPLSAVGNDLMWTGIYILPALLIGYVALRFKEVAR